MLKQRIITGIFLAIIAIFGLLYLPLGNYFIAFVTLILALGAYEWNKMTKLSLLENIIWTLVLLTATTLTWLYWEKLLTMFSNLFFLEMAVFWVLMMSALYFYPHKKDYLNNKWIRILIGLFLLGLTFDALVFVKHLGNIYLIFVALTIIFADTGAYFSGKAFGKHKLAPSVSPGKTWEGLLGALILNAVFAVIFANFFGSEMIFTQESFLANSIIWILIAWVISVMSVIGDLFESMIKRISGVKDSSNILPGHGGILDRLDGFTAALPTFVICVYLFKHLIGQ